ncbi:hypothetical protein HBB16_13100 [Pseudonocardia sp. MCCB 268]|nr:hypothetical protein [Pseudonocardia cytotoxica]
MLRSPNRPLGPTRVDQPPRQGLHSVHRRVTLGALRGVDGGVGLEAVGHLLIGPG